MSNATSNQVHEIDRRVGRAVAQVAVDAVQPLTTGALLELLSRACHLGVGIGLDAGNATVRDWLAAKAWQP